LFVSNAAYNNLGRPTWSTGFNWSRDAAVIPILAAVIGTGLGAISVVMIQSLAALLVGTAAALTAYRFVKSIDPEGPRQVVPDAIAAPFSSGRSVQVTIAEQGHDPLAERDESR
ncbi:MAG: hypothetical protein AAGI70_00785, partial [Pseudomonadota bacterium]